MDAHISALVREAYSGPESAASKQLSWVGSVLPAVVCGTIGVFYWWRFWRNKHGAPEGASATKPPKTVEDCFNIFQQSENHLKEELDSLRRQIQQQQQQIEALG